MIYKIKAEKSFIEKPILSGHLKMGDKNPDNSEINVNSRYISKNKKPWLPIMGEFHFSRFPNLYWEEELLKMKACGINIISSYILWIHHEEIEGQFDWSLDKNLRSFVQLCHKHGLYVFVRIGPWSHGECRNGGFPDWILGKCTPRTNDPKYMVYVKRFYKEISKQLNNLFYKDGGPIIGIQFENELMNNEEHLRALKELALEYGMKAPIYSATGWGDGDGAKIPLDEMIPSFGGYPDHPWENSIKALHPKYKYFFNHGRNDSDIGSDLLKKHLSLKSSRSENIERYPYLSCEMGPGVQITYHRRSIIKYKDTAAMMIVKIGSGVNLLGYYMFHGGSNFIGKLSTMQESKDTGYPNDLPVISYDFQAPIGEFGLIRDSYYSLKIINMFLNDFGEELADMVSVLPERMPTDCFDNDTLRYAARVSNKKGFIFFNNYQRFEKMKDKNNVRIEIDLEDQVMVIPSNSFTVKGGSYFILPFNMDISDGVTLKYGMLQPICKLNLQNEIVYFFSELDEIEPEYLLDNSYISSIEIEHGNLVQEEDSVFISNLKPGTNCIITIKTKNNKIIKLVTLKSKEAFNLWKGKAFGSELVVITEANVLFMEDSIKIYGTDPQKMTFSTYPEIAQDIVYKGALILKENEGLFKQYIPSVSKKEIEVSFEDNDSVVINGDYFKYLFTENSSKEVSREWKVNLPENIFDGVNDVFLKLSFIGDVAQVYINGKLSADCFYNGESWVIGLKRFKQELDKGQFVMKISPLLKESPIYIEKWPEINGEKICKILSIEAITEYMIEIK